MKKSRALIDRNPMAIDKDLANVFGLDLAALLQHVHFSITEKESNPRKYFNSYKNGFFWYYDTKKSISEQMPFLGAPRTIQRLISKGQEMLVLIVEEFNALPGDNTNWFRIDHTKLDEIMQEYYSKKYPEMADFYAQADQEEEATPRQIGSTPKTFCPGPQDKMSLPPRQIGSTNTIDFSENSHRKDLNTPFNPPTGETSEIKQISLLPVLVEPKTVTPKTKKVAKDYTPDFERFWDLYPEKESKAGAFAAWKKLNPNQDLQDTILKDVALRIENDSRWLERYVPFPARYLKERRWESPIKPASQKPKAHMSKHERNQAVLDEYFAKKGIKTNGLT